MLQYIIQPVREVEGREHTADHELAGALHAHVDILDIINIITTTVIIKDLSLIITIAITTIH